MSTSRNDSVWLAKGNPRTQSPYLSVSLRHELPNITPQSSFLASKPHHSKGVAKQRPVLVNHSSDENDAGSDATNWFERANTNPRAGFKQSFQDEPPYFIARGSTNGSPRMNRSKLENRFSGPSHTLRSSTSSSNGYRSIIDDLTIENRKLKEEIKRLKRSHNAHLAKDRLFEITIHEMSAHDRRRLERQLREFTASLNESSSTEDRKTTLGSASQDLPMTDSKPKNSITSVDSNSLPIDSAYSSMTSLLPNTSDMNPGSVTKEARQEKAENIENFLENIPELPKHFAVMTERQKKKLVVQRLEQLFTGKRSMQSKDHSQPQQQQEVSQSAREPEDGSSSNEGLREAHMLLNPMEIQSRPRNLSRVQSSNENQDSSTASQSSEVSPAISGQRPTRPLDLDPDRAQVAVDNVEYLRHLGLSTPQLLSEDSSDAEPDAQGWIYLNLLINMAQLHIVNVTPDFVRHAVREVSEKFQLSRDGDKLRWRGGSQGTHLSSDGGRNSGPNQSSDDSDSISEVGGKRRKIDGGRFAAIPIETQKSRLSKSASAMKGGIHYRPIFNHQNSFSDSSETSSKSNSTSLYDEHYGTGQWRNQCSWSATSGSGSQKKKRRDDGTIVFYNNARFCTDLSAEVPPPFHAPEASEDGFSNNSNNALGCEPRKARATISRTPSGSLLAVRPFKKGVVVEAEQPNSNTPDLLVYDADDSNAPQSPGCNLGEDCHYQDFEVCGFNGIRPEDHFAVHVLTRRTRARQSTATKLSSFSAPGAATKRFHHRIPESSLSSFAEPDPYETITNKLSCLTTWANALPTRSQKTPIDFPIVLEYSRPKFVKLNPSPVPAPIGYYGESSNSSSQDEYMTDEPSSRQSNLNPSTWNWTKNVSGKMQEVEEEEDDKMDEAHRKEEEEEDNEEDDDDDDESIDMLAHLRASNPEEVARREAEFDMTIDDISGFMPRSSLATGSETTDSDDSY